MVSNINEYKTQNTRNKSHSFPVYYNFYFILLPLISRYCLSVGIFVCLLQYYSKIRANLVPAILWLKKIVLPLGSGGGGIAASMMKKQTTRKIKCLYSSNISSFILTKGESKCKIVFKLFLRNVKGRAIAVLWIYNAFFMIKEFLKKQTI